MDFEILVSISYIICKSLVVTSPYKDKDYEYLLITGVGTESGLVQGGDPSCTTGERVPLRGLESVEP